MARFTTWLTEWLIDWRTDWPKNRKWLPDQKWWRPLNYLNYRNVTRSLMKTAGMIIISEYMTIITVNKAAQMNGFQIKIKKVNFRPFWSKLGPIWPQRQYPQYGNLFKALIMLWARFGANDKSHNMTIYTYLKRLLATKSEKNIERFSRKLIKCLFLSNFRPIFGPFGHVWCPNSRTRFFPDMRKNQENYADSF